MNNVVEVNDLDAPARHIFNARKDSLAIVNNKYKIKFLSEFDIYNFNKSNLSNSISWSGDILVYCEDGVHNGNMFIDHHLDLMHLNSNCSMTILESNSNDIDRMIMISSIDFE